MPRSYYQHFYALLLHALPISPSYYFLIVPKILNGIPFSNTPTSSLILSLTIVKKDLLLEFFIWFMNIFKNDIISKEISSSTMCFGKTWLLR
jgi:hypothetical protein